MPNNEKQYYIYLRSTKECVPCTKDEFNNYYRDINAFRQRQQYHGKCVCPKASGLPVTWTVKPVHSTETTLFLWNTLFVMTKETKEQKRMR